MAKKKQYSYSIWFTVETTHPYIVTASTKPQAITRAKKKARQFHSKEELVVAKYERKPYVGPDFSKLDRWLD